MVQLFGTHHGDYFGQEYPEEIVMAQMGFIFRSPPVVYTCFFCHLGALQIVWTMAVLWPLSDAGPYFGGFAPHM